MKPLAFLMMVVGAVIGTGAALEFAYFGPGTSQFIVGLFTTPAGLAYLMAGVQLWRGGPHARPLVAVATSMLLLAVAGAVYLDVMGPPAVLLGGTGILCSGVWVTSQTLPKHRRRSERGTLYSRRNLLRELR